ncbi:MAG: hypothetical protein AVO35_02015 [Candidatus Aegiribacteria sp. MLS_C]|nr:MAG: hypothetical protein AVO35_02015 [Candidatus Aegiribacteria sp. MLS_C]
MSKGIVTLLLGVLLAVAGCGGEEPAENGSEASVEGENTPAAEDEGYALPEADVYLYVADSIGVELGDSNYVLGQIAGVGLTHEGGLAVLDMQKTSISIYSPTGEFQRSIGRQGSGPGEFLLPVGMTFFPAEEGSDLPDSLRPGAVVCDAMGGKLVYFDINLDYMMDVQGFFPSPPAVLAGIEGGDVVGMKPEFVQDETGMYMGFTIARWPLGEPEPSVIYFESMSPFDPSDLSTMQDDIVSFGSNDDGMVLTAPLSTDSYEFTLWDPEGNLVFTFADEDYEKVPKTASEIELEREMVNARMVQQGMPASMANWEPDPYRPAVGGLSFDGMNRIWVTRGTTRTPSFDVYDTEGNHLFTAAVDAGEDAMTWQVVISGDRFIAFDADPEFYPQVFIGDLPDFVGPAEPEETGI